MKKLFFSLLLLLFISAAHAQNVRLNVYGNYVFDDQVDNAYSYGNEGYFNGTVKGGLVWGGGLEYRLHQYYGLELMYLRLDTHAPVDYYDYNNIINHNEHADLDLSVNYIMLGGVRSFKPNQKVDPFGGFMLGMAIINSKDNSTDPVHHKIPDGNATKFVWGARLGTNIWASEKVGIKLQAQFLSIPQGAGGSLYFGTGGAGAGVSTYSTVFQFVLGGGLVFKLGH